MSLAGGRGKRLRPVFVRLLIGIWGIEMRDENLGLDLRPGDEHYRAYVGPPQDYDLISAMVFNLLTTLGLRQHHTVIDIGCGSLRNGRLLIPYLNAGNYIGIEPNKWLIDDGVKYETGNDLVRIKRPALLVGDSADVLSSGMQADFVFAQSIFSHCGLDLIEQWLCGIKPHLKDGGVFVATFLVGEEDFEGAGWIYPGCVKYKLGTISAISSRLGYHFKMLNWWHPRQNWCLFHKDGYDASWIDEHSLNWNNANSLRSAMGGS